MEEIEYKLCSECNERIPSMTFVKGMYRQCYKEGGTIKKFFKKNNIDLGDVPEELQDLTEIEEILIA